MKNILSTASIALALLLTACANSNGRSNPEGAAQPTESADPGAPSPERNSPISWTITPRNSYLLRNGNNESYLYLSLKSGADETSKNRIPLNISLVLDRSGSMAGDKIANAKRAAKFVIDQLGPEDMLSIVNYDNVVEVTSRQQYVRNKESLKRLVDGISDRGGTNLTAGMLEGFRQVQSMKREGYINRVLLLTDGLANEGITNPTEIKALVRRQYQQAGIALSTFGLGAGYNEDLLTAMAEVGGANYYFIENARGISGIFNKELKGLLSVMAKDAVVSISLPAGTMCDKVYGYPFDVVDGKITIRLNDIYANDEKGVVIKLLSNRVSEGLEIAATLRYTESKHFKTVSETRRLRLAITNDRTAYEASLNKEVDEKVAMFEANEDFDKILKEVDNGNYKEAKGKAMRSIKALQEKQAVAPSAALRLREEEISNYTKDLDKVEAMPAADRSIYQKATKSSNYEMKKMRK